jgi:hypothetical protein
MAGPLLAYRAFVFYNDLSSQLHREEMGMAC